MDNVQRKRGRPAKVAEKLIKMPQERREELMRGVQQVIDNRFTREDLAREWSDGHCVGYDNGYNDGHSEGNADSFLSTFLTTISIGLLFVIAWWILSGQPLPWIS